MKRVLVGLLFIFVLGFVWGQDFSAVDGSYNSGTYNAQFSSPYSSYSNEYWPIFGDYTNEERCEDHGDFLIMIPPLGCEPSVVRSDLLSEQNVPVFCQLSALQVNPSIKVEGIDSITFSGDYPDEISSVSFYPARSALKSTNSLEGSPYQDNIGYVVLNLKRTLNESAQGDRVKGNLTARIKFDAEDAYGVGQAEFYLEKKNEDEWEKGSYKSSFWQGKGYVRVDEISGEGARVILYDSNMNVVKSLSLERGDTSDEFYFPGFYCRAKLKVRLNELVAPEDSATLYVDGNAIEVYEGSSLLNGQCRVTKLSAVGGVGSIAIRCPGQTVELGRSVDKKVKIGSKAVSVGDVLGSEGEVNTLVGFVGTVPETENFDKDIRGEQFAILVDSKRDSLTAEELIKISERVFDVLDLRNGVDLKYFNERLKTIYGFSNVQVRFDIQNSNEKPTSLEGVNGDTPMGSALLEEHKAVDKLETFLGEKMLGDVSYAEEAAWKEIETVKKMLANGQGRSAVGEDYLIQLLKDFQDKFSGSARASMASQELYLLSQFGSENAYASVYVKGEGHTITLASFKGVSDSDKIARIRIDGATYSGLTEGKCVDIDVGTGACENNKGERVYVRNINYDRVSLEYHYIAENSDGTHLSKESVKSFALYEGQEAKDVEGRLFSLSDVDVEGVARVSIIPVVQNEYTEANFTYNIGIEQRAIQLTPEKAEEGIKDLNEQIDEWGELLNKSGKVLEAWNGACYATSIVLQFKRLLQGFSGGASARENVMDYYRSKCNSDEKYKDDRDACYSYYNNKGLESDVSAEKRLIEDMNDALHCYDSVYEWLGKETPARADSKCVAGDVNGKVTLVDGRVVNLNQFTSFDEVRAYLKVKMAEGGSYGFSDGYLTYLKSQRDATLSRLVRSSESLNSVAGILGSWSTDSDALKQKFAKNCIYADGATDSYVSDVNCKFTSEEANEIVSGGVMEGITNEVTMILVSHHSGVYLAIKGLGAGAMFYKVNEASLGSNELVVTGDGIGSLSATEGLTANSLFTSISSSGKCVNPNPNPQLKFFDSGEYKGLVSEMALDNDKGFYVRVTGSSGGLLSDGIKSYLDNGGASNFYICNIGVDRIQGSSDDLCQNYYVQRDASVEFGVCGLSASEFKSLGTKAQKMLREATSYYGKSGLGTTVNVNGVSMKISSPAADTPNYECQDFMSVDECNLLFNVCDPVVCPSSRCDLGGKYKVSNVIQTGIVGSVFLCLHNFGNPFGEEGGVLVPFCLSGIYSGLDAYVSVLKAQRDCLNDYKETGQYTGMCDEISSVYLCELFWREGKNFVDLGVAWFAEGLYTGNWLGSSGRGGGEYMVFQNAWENLQQSMAYFKQDYASTTFNPLRFGGVEEVGSEVCKAFVGSSFPTNAEISDEFLQPASPVQFYAKFTEVPFTEATSPPTSQYKVTYHIYAGNDRGVSYRVYLKTPPTSAYYYTSDVVNVDSGYINVGEYVSNSDDFTAPAGYKELCVVFNGEERCGFGQVTTDYGLNLLSDQYVKDQAEDISITSEDECVSGSSSAWALANLNLGEGVSEAVSPDINARGLVRVCATENPGAGVNLDRWVKVGNCGVASIGCWLDKNSVNSAANIAINISDTISEAESKFGSLTSKDYEASLYDYDETLSYVRGVLNDDKKFSSSNREALVSKLDLIISPPEDGAPINSQKQAQAYYLKSEIYRKTIELLLASVDASVIEVSKGRSEVVAPVGEVSDGSDGGDGEEIGSIISSEVVISDLKGFKFDDEKGILAMDESGDGKILGYVLKQVSDNKYEIRKDSNFWGSVWNGINIFSDTNHVGWINPDGEMVVDIDGEGFLEKLEECTFDFGNEEFDCSF
jgi:hypothetical protein